MGGLWRFLTAFGDAAVLVPCVLLTLLALAGSSESRHLIVGWLTLLASVAAIVVFSKLLFMAWGIGLPGLNFIGLSGHSAMSASVWPTQIGLLACCGGRRWRSAGISLGLALAAGIGISRLELHAHSISEVVSGLLAGAVPSLVFLKKQGDDWKLSVGARWVIPFLIGAIALMHGTQFPSQVLLMTMAKGLSADGNVHIHRALKH